MLTFCDGSTEFLGLGLVSVSFLLLNKFFFVGWVGFVKINFPLTFFILMSVRMISVWSSWPELSGEIGLAWAKLILSGFDCSFKGIS